MCTGTCLHIHRNALEGLSVTFFFFYLKTVSSLTSSEKLFFSFQSNLNKIFMHHHFYLLMLSALLKGIWEEKKASPFLYVCDNRSVICRLIKTNVLRVIFSHFYGVCLCRVSGMGSKINGTKSWKIVIWDLPFILFILLTNLFFFFVCIFILFIFLRFVCIFNEFKTFLGCAVAWFCV